MCTWGYLEFCLAFAVKARARRAARQDGVWVVFVVWLWWCVGRVLVVCVDELVRGLPTSHSSCTLPKAKAKMKQKLLFSHISLTEI